MGGWGLSCHVFLSFYFLLEALFFSGIRDDGGGGTRCQEFAMRMRMLTVSSLRVGFVSGNNGVRIRIRHATG